MAVRYGFEGRTIAVRMDVDYSIAALIDAVQASLADPRRPSQPMLLLDGTTGFVPMGITAADLHALGRFLVSAGRECGCAVALVAPSEVGFGILRACAGYAETRGVKARVFREAAAARDWLAHRTAAGAADLHFEAWLARGVLPPPTARRGSRPSAARLRAGGRLLRVPSDPRCLPPRGAERTAGEPDGPSGLSPLSGSKKRPVRRRPR